MFVCGQGECKVGGVPSSSRIQGPGQLWRGAASGADVVCYRLRRFGWSGLVCCMGCGAVSGNGVHPWTCLCLSGAVKGCWCMVHPWLWWGGCLPIMMEEGLECMDGQDLCIGGSRRGAGDGGLYGVERMQQFVLKEGVVEGRPW